jgi:FixJ family two-component response regulator
MLPDVDGLSLQKVLNENDSHLPIVFMSGYGSISMSVKAMKRGAVNFLSKPFTREELLGAINEALVQNIKYMKETFEKDHINARMETLTPREKEVMRWVISGRRNKQIAWELGTVEKTIKVHRSRVMQKTGADSVAELVRMTEKIGILPLD